MHVVIILPSLAWRNASPFKARWQLYVWAYRPRKRHKSEGFLSGKRMLACGETLGKCFHLNAMSFHLICSKRYMFYFCSSAKVYSTLSCILLLVCVLYAELPLLCPFLFAYCYGHKLRFPVIFLHINYKFPIIKKLGYVIFTKKKHTKKLFGTLHAFFFFTL